MNQHLQSLLNFIEQDKSLSADEKKALLKSLKDVDKELEITTFKLDRTEKVKRTTAILLEETIEELENKRKAVEAQNRELEIESSLERVRTVAMSMNKPDDMLHVCRVISEQLELLKVKEIRNVQTAIFYEDKGTYMNYEYYAKHNKTIITETSYTNHEIHQAFADKMLKGNGEFMVAHIKGDEVKAWIAYQKTTNVFIDDYLYTASSLNYYWFSLGPVALGISTYSPLSEDEINLFKRFLKVFELSYRRYLDIEKAEAQAHEAKVEASLEKVRAVAMSMNKPDDLLNICETLYKEFSAFGFADIRNAMINIHDDENKTFVNYDYSDTIGKSTNHLHYDLHPVIKKQIKQIRTANDAFSETVFAGEDLDDWKKFRKEIGEKDDPRINDATALYYYFYSIGTGSVGISTFSPMSEENLQLLKRFRNVFNLCYQRYADLALAEAQAKEAKIEASLERMRSAAMSMRKSEELIIVCEAMYKELTVLGFTNIRNAQIAIKNDTKQSYLISVYSNYEALVMQEAPYKSSPIVEELYNELGKSKDAFFQKEFAGKKFDDWRKWRESLSEFTDSRETEATSMCFYLYSIGTGHLGISTFNAITNDQVEILKRFKNVFELSYTRYIDVAQAEAQAKEAKIEAALERVRAQAMSIRKSEELASVGEIIFEQLKLLGFSDLRNTEIIINNDTKESIFSYYSDYGITGTIEVFYKSNPTVQHWANELKKAKDGFAAIEISENEIEAWRKYREEIGYQPDPKLNEAKSVFYYSYSTGLGALSISSFTKISDEQIKTLERFRNVFGLAYRRYADVAQAEAQAREAQIELALERVRARTMAMQKSDELSETVFILFQQFKQLGENPDQATIGIVNESERVIEYWVTMYGNQTNRVFKFPIDEPNVTNRIYKAWKEQKKSLVIELTGKELFDFANFRESMGGAAYNPEEKKRVINVAFFSKGIINVQSNESRSEESIRLLERFAGVFEQTYTRFLDLKKAEALAREAKIEAALEKVRSRSLAMHKSDEIKEVVVTVMEKMNELNIKMNGGVSLVTFIPNSNDLLHWYVNPGHVADPVTMRLPYFDNLVFNDFVKARNEGKDILPVVYSFEEKNEYFSYAFEHSEFKIAPEELKKWIFEQPYFGYSVAIQKHSAIFFNDYTGKFFSKEDNDILIRFSRVFEQAYVRFLDLQKAEAQARESQIQLALERVRARTMAMQKSEELSETAYILYQQFSELGKDPVQITIGVVNETEGVIELWITKEGNQMDQLFKAPIEEPIVMNKIYVAWKEQKKSLIIDISGQQLKEYNNFRNSLSDIDFNNDSIEDRRVINIAFFSKGLISVSYIEPAPTETVQLLERFAGVFDLTYTRFLDLKKAEAQAKESQIQLALERVRARTMAMQHSDELKEAAALLFQQAKALGVPAYSCGYNIWEKDEKTFTSWMSSEDGSIINAVLNIPLTEDANFIRYATSKQNGEQFFVLELRGERMQEHYAYLKTIPAFKAYFDYAVSVGFDLPETQIHHIANFSHGNLLFISLEPCPEFHDVFKRFAAVFEQTYTRFLDLQKAEAQAREAQIETALERVRSRTMAMQQSYELNELVITVFKELTQLDFSLTRGAIVIMNSDALSWREWTAEMDMSAHSYFVQYADFPYHRTLIENWKQRNPKWMYDLKDEEMKNLTRYLITESEYRRIPDAVKEIMLNTPEIILSHSFSNFGYLRVDSLQPVADESLDILNRFAKVFDQTYTRFNDLKQAEAQARESQIEAALERVRSRSMGMQKSEELKEVIQVVYDQFVHLNIHIEHTGFLMNYKERDDMHIWLADQHLVPSEVTIPFFDSPPNNSIKEAKEKGQDFFTYHLTFEEKNKFYRDLFKFVPGVPEETLEYYFNCPGLAGSGVLLENIGLYIENFSGTPYSDEENNTLMRFGKVFQQTYTRFLDLQKAEAQARESQIEAALERVRSRTMAMQNSDELAELVATVFTELNRLEFALTSCIIWINNPESLTAEMWVASTELNKPPEPYYIKPFRHPYFKSVIDAWKQKNKKWVYEMNGEEKKVFQEQFFNEVGSFPTLIKKALEAPESVVYSASFYNFGALEIVGTEHVTDEKFEILHRLGKVFDMSYTRFNDLKQAEAQAQEARIETALERVRSRTLAMQKSDELAETAAVLFRQLILLGIAPNRLYIGIIKDDNDHIEFWVTDEDGSKVSTQFTGNINRNASMKKMYGAWKEEKKSLTIDMHGKELEDYFHYLADELNVPFKQGLSQKRRIQSIAFFGKGFIGIASPDEQPEATISLLERFAAVFNLTYTRFNDLKIAEAHAIQAEEDLIKLQTEKKRAEDALTELRTTQAQLIQSEKMASLGELTAGIAHEIQNPLNFVNNFSEVNTELIAEMKEEIDKGNIEEVRAIANDIADNEQKINHHGKRADAIVKGMLQHSRSSSATKEPTDINKLADEYLRLAYHGLRAKDKSFNATLHTAYDETIGNINIVPQDIGRVILNLITNAFYAINEKAKKSPLTPGGGTGNPQKEYEPTIWIKTSMTPPSGGREAVLTVTDNGNGIPQNIVDKIFQPFFTTKPTGQGTGLGLSLAYDIVKAHGGELRVETKEGEGSEFIIQLPLV